MKFCRLQSPEVSKTKPKYCSKTTENPLVRRFSVLFTAHMCANFAVEAMVLRSLIINRLCVIKLHTPVGPHPANGIFALSLQGRGHGDDGAFAALARAAAASSCCSHGGLRSLALLQGFVE